MSLRDRLFQSIAALDRIAPPADVETASQFSASSEDEKIPVPDSRPASIYSQQPHDEKFIRLSTSTLSLPPGPYLRRSRSLPSLTESRFAPEIDTSKMDSPHGEPKITLRYAAQIARHILTIAFSFLSIGTAIAIIGLAADGINWGTGRGGQAANTVIAVVSGGYDAVADARNTWITKMMYLPSIYDTSTFTGLIVAGSVAVLGGVVAAPLSIAYWRSTNRAVQLGSRNALSQKWTLHILLVLEAIMFLTTVIVLIYVRSLYVQNTGYNPYDQGANYIQAKYFDPPLPANRSHEAPAPYEWVPVDDEIRYYDSPVHYNPMNWNCRLHGLVGANLPGGVSSHRLFQLCEEGNAARWLLVVMLALQGAVLASHAWAWVELKRGRNGGWMRQQRGERAGENESE